jgi:hypothetical protein
VSADDGAPRNTAIPCARFPENEIRTGDGVSGSHKSNESCRRPRDPGRTEQSQRRHGGTNDVCGLVTFDLGDVSVFRCANRHRARNDTRQRVPARCIRHDELTCTTAFDHFDPDVDDRPQGRVLHLPAKRELNCGANSPPSPTTAQVPYGTRAGATRSGGTWVATRVVVEFIVMRLHRAG